MASRPCRLVSTSQRGQRTTTCGDGSAAGDVEYSASLPSCRRCWDDPGSGLPIRSNCGLRCPAATRSPTDHTGFLRVPVDRVRFLGRRFLLETEHVCTLVLGPPGVVVQVT